MSRRFAIDDMFMKSSNGKVYEGEPINKLINWKERSQLLSAIQFLTLYSDDEFKPICIFAEQFDHIYFLSRLFPKLKFHVYNSQLQSNKRITNFEENLNDKTVNKYLEQESLLFFGNYDFPDYETTEREMFTRRRLFEKDTPKFLIKEVRKETINKYNNEINKYLVLQQSLLMAINPDHAFLTFSLPYSKNDDIVINYLSGSVFRIPYVGGSHFTMLKPERDENGFYFTKNWSSKSYKEMAKQFITMKEYSKFGEVLDHPELLDDYDSALEHFILKNYLRKFGEKERDAKLISRAITEELNDNVEDEISLSIVRG